MKRVVYLLVAAVVVMGFVACGDDGGEASAVTDDGIVTSDELQDNSFAINGEVESFKSLALSNLGEYLCIVGSTHEGVGVFDDFFVGDNDYFYVAISPVLKGAEFDMMTEQAEELMEKADKKRAAYYNYYSYKTWGAASTYHLCIDSSVMGIDRTVEYLLQFIKHKLGL